MSEVKLVFFGDVYIPHGEPEPQIADEIRDLVQVADLVICNLEAPVTKSTVAIQKIGPTMQQGNEAINFIKAMKVGLVGLANNHMIDYSHVGLEDTFSMLRENNIEHIGAGVLSSAYNSHRFECNGIVVSILAAAENGFGCCSEDANYGFAWVLDPKFERKVIEEVAECDHVILFLHAGVEFIDNPLPEWRSLYKKFIDMGCSAVIAHHPHVVQGMEYHKGKPIYYSLGNYYFGMEDCDPRWYQNLMVEIKLLRDSNEVRVSEYYGEFKVGKIVECNSLAVNHRFDTLSKQLNSEEYLPSLEAELRERWINFYRDSYAYPMRGLVGKFGIRELIKKLIDFIARREMSMTQVNMLWHNIVIESHRWAVQRILSTRLF